jgi:hypothetical protein
MSQQTYSNPDFTGKRAFPITWLSNLISPYNVSLARGRQVKLRYEVYSDRAKFRDLPVLSLVEIKNGESEIIAELPAAMGYTNIPFERVKIKSDHPANGKWVTIESTAVLSENVNAAKISLFATRDNQIMDIFIDNVEMEIE